MTTVVARPAPTTQRPMVVIVSQVSQMRMYPNMYQQVTFRVILCHRVTTK